MTTRRSASGVRLIRIPPTIAATATAAVPWMSSLNEQIRSRCAVSNRLALRWAKSSHCSSTPGQRARSASTNASIELVVVGVAQAAMSPAEVQRIGQQRLVLGAGVEEHRQRSLGIDPTDRGVEGELADRDAHAADAEVAEAEDAFAVGDHDDIDVDAHTVGRQRVVEQFGDAVPVRPRHVQAVLASVHPRPLLAGEADRRRVDDGQQLLEVVDEESIEQHRVGGLQSAQEDVPGEVAVRGVELGADPAQLRVEVFHDRRQQAVQPVQITLGDAERRALVVDTGWPAVDDRRASPVTRR